MHTLCIVTNTQGFSCRAWRPGLTVVSVNYTEVECICMMFCIDEFGPQFMWIASHIVAVLPDLHTGLALLAQPSQLYF